MSKIGLLFGSFNPIHNGHINLAQEALATGKIDKVFFVIAKQNPFKETYDISTEDRCSLLSSINLPDNMQIIFNEITHNLSGITWDTLQDLKKDYPNDEFIIVCGTDMYKDINRWENGKDILNNYKFIISLRDNPEDPSVISYILSNKTKEISSTQIKKYIKMGKDISNLVPKEVLKVIKDKQLYER